MKERLFREYGQLLGSDNKNVTVIHTWGAGEGLDTTVIIYDPLGRVAYSIQQSVPRGMGNTLVTRTTLKSPFLPGIWTAKIIYANQVVAHRPFLILPVLYKNRKLNPGSLPLITDYHFDTITTSKIELYKSFLSDSDILYTVTEYNKLVKSPTSSILLYFDKLVEKFWRTSEVCLIDSNPTCSFLPMCTNTLWSSFAPDPKSDLGSIDPKTGRIERF